MNKKFKILIITPIKHIKKIHTKLSNLGKLKLCENINQKQFKKIIVDYDIIFTNPNKSKIYLGEKNLKYAKNLKIICTASTGTNHIDLVYAKSKKIKIISLKKETNVIKKISSTAELATALTLSAVRNIPEAFNSVLLKEWDYEKFIGKQFNELCIGIIGYGRLGKIYSKLVNAFGANVIAYDPYIEIKNKKIIQINSLDKFVKKCDVISLHVHVNDDTINMVNNHFLSKCKSNVIIINTSRGEIVNEIDILKFLNKNPLAKYYCDVLSDEIKNKFKSPIFKKAISIKNKQVFITPHIGGMTTKAQEIAYGHVIELLSKEIR